MVQELTIAMPKGRIFQDAAKLLRQAGIELPADFEDSRKLIITAENCSIHFILAKPVDVPTYVEYGVADMGIAGKDVMMEEQRDVYEVLDLGISACHMAVAGLPESKRYPVTYKVATKYPKTAAQYFRQKGEQVEVITLNGSIELAPLVGLADCIVDIVSTGRTLKENGLVETEKISDITSRLIVNPVSYRLKKIEIDQLIGKLTEVVKENTYGMDQKSGSAVLK
ncbi:ATP phosphoribosyltransferase [Scopulibacillus cellulosilyticus]|uniref:ATP phosphoribosyltransferase n=1 Tax=Scopulibacillus cellulosilyticus TaxID=2665665 RepID=A0ABW2PWU6_9BACL